MKNAKPNLLKKIEELKQSIITTGMDKLRQSNIDKIRKLNELIKKVDNNDRI